MVVLLIGVVAKVLDVFERLVLVVIGDIGFPAVAFPEQFQVHDVVWGLHERQGVTLRVPGQAGLGRRPLDGGVQGHAQAVERRGQPMQLLARIDLHAVDFGLAAVHRHGDGDARRIVELAQGAVADDR